MNRKTKLNDYKWLCMCVFYIDDMFLSILVVKVIEEWRTINFPSKIYVLAGIKLF